MKHAGDVRPITHLKNRTADVVREVNTTGRTMMITQNGEARVVVMDVATYQRWRSTMALLKVLALAESDVEAKRTVPQAAAFRRAAAALRRATRDA